MTGRIAVVVLSVLVLGAAVLTQVIDRSREARRTNLTVFIPASYEAAFEQAKALDRVFVVDFMADWCGPCKEMDRTTWRDPQILRWINDQGIAVQVDIDDQRRLAQEFNITAIPTIVVFNGDEEIVRHTGYLGPGDMIEILEEAKAAGMPPRNGTEGGGG